jgi:5-methylcytosine-specific restriction endonuclease McrA
MAFTNAERRRRYRASHLEEVKVIARAAAVRRRITNPERLREIGRRAAKKRLAKCPDKVREQVRRAMATWRRKHPGKAAAARAIRRARETAAAVPLTPEEQAKVIALYAEAKALTELIGKAYHVDHIVPLSKGGLHHPNNLQVLRAVDNLRKGARVLDFKGRETCG